MGREYLKDARRTGQRLDPGVHLRIQSMSEELPLASVPCIAEAMGATALIVFYTLTEVPGVRFPH
jgi:hypothetical protein